MKTTHFGASKRTERGQEEARRTPCPQDSGRRTNLRRQAGGVPYSHMLDVAALMWTARRILRSCRHPRTRRSGVGRAGSPHGDRPMSRHRRKASIRSTCTNPDGCRRRFGCQGPTENGGGFRREAQDEDGRYRCEEGHPEPRRLLIAQKGDSGFTMIELLLVIVVLGILAATAIVALGSVTSSAAQASCSSDAKVSRSQSRPSTITPRTRRNPTDGPLQLRN